jgi:hypothetical protein
MALGAVGVDDDRMGEECSAGCRTQPAGRRRSPKPPGREAQAMPICAFGIENAAVITASCVSRFRRDLVPLGS